MMKQVVHSRWLSVWGISKLGVICLGVPVVRIIIYGVYLGVPLILENYHSVGLSEGNLLPGDNVHRDPTWAHLCLYPAKSYWFVVGNKGIIL